jgi:hypothetical protein
MWTERGKRARSDAAERVCWARWTRALFPLVLFSATAAICPAQEYARFGLSLKSGEGAGPMGIQLAWNFNRHLQACIGGGGTAEVLSWLDRSRTDSYFLMGKYYLDHLYFETGYSVKTTRAENVFAEKVRLATRTEQGVPFYVGYEFGHRRGFYFSTAAGYLYVFGGGGKVVSPQIDAQKGTTATSARSSPSFGMSVGYYLW